MTSLILEDKVTSSDVAPGFLAFVAFFSLAVILYFLMRNMNSRMRRMSYRQDAAGRTKNQPQATQDEAMEGLRGHAGIDPAPSRSSESAISIATVIGSWPVSTARNNRCSPFSARWRTHLT